MDLVQTFEDIKENIERLNKYLSSNNWAEKKFATDLIKKGRCFFAVKYLEAGYSFYPSRFIGYKNNTMTKHQNNNEKDGKETNPVINRILGFNCGTVINKNSDIVEWESFENKYIEYCANLGKPSQYQKRKYWVIR